MVLEIDSEPKGSPFHMAGMVRNVPFVRWLAKPGQVYCRAPNSKVPIRTMVLPSSSATL